MIKEVCRGYEIGEDMWTLPIDDIMGGVTTETLLLSPNIQNR